MELKDHAMDDFVVMMADSFQVQLLIMEHCTSGGNIACSFSLRSGSPTVSTTLTRVHYKVNKVHLQLR